MRYWLVKTEPSCYSIDDLRREKIGVWSDVRNYQARNHLRAMKKGDRLLFYHSSTDVVGVVGIARVSREAYPDPSQFDSRSDTYDAKSTEEHPRWDAVDVRFEKKFHIPITLKELKNDPYFTEMLVVRKGMRLSVQPVLEKHFVCIEALAQTKK